MVRFFPTKRKKRTNEETMKNRESILTFDKHRKRVKTCPCGRDNKDGKFSPFVGYTDKGHCHGCGETFFPDKPVRSFFIPREREQTNTVSYLPSNVFESSVAAHERCNLFPFLVKLFTTDVAKSLCENYFVGASRHGDTVFWQVDVEDRIRQAKVIKYDSETGKRSKVQPPFFAGKKILGNKEVSLKQSLFGEHLLANPTNGTKAVAVCEGEKTCLIASIYHPAFVWLATGGKNGCSLTEKQTCRILTGKRVILFPDANAYGLWCEKAKLLEAVAGCRVVVSDIIEKFATAEEKAKGLDLADYLLRKEDETGLALTDHRYPVIWDYK
jgi:uncharacterized protein DUF6371